MPTNNSWNSQDPAQVALGGTGAQTFTAHGVLLGEGTSAIVATSVGTDGQVLTGNSAADPSFQSIGTKSGLTAHGVVIAEGSSAFAATAAGTALQVLQSGGASADPTWSTATYPATTTINQLLYSSSNNTVAGISASANGVLVSSNSNVPSWLANGTAGQVLTAQSSAPPAWTNPTSPFVWSQITTATTAVAGHGYQVTSGTVTVTLPATAAVGDTVAIMLAGGTSFVVRTAGAGAGVITLGATSSSASPASIQSVSGSTGAAITLICVTANTGWQALSAVGNFVYTVI